MIDQGSTAEIMYPNLYKGLNLKLESLTAYSSPLVSFDGKMVIPKGQTRFPVQTGSDVVEVDFIVVDVFSPYTAIMGRPTLASYLGSHLLHSSPEGEISLRGLGVGDSRKSVYDQAVPGSGHPTSATAENGLQQSETLTSLFNRPSNEVKCEDLEKLIVGDDLEKFFQIGAQLPLLDRE